MPAGAAKTTSAIVEARPLAAEAHVAVSQAEHPGDIWLRSKDEFSFQSPCWSTRLLSGQYLQLVHRLTFPANPLEFSMPVFCSSRCTRKMSASSDWCTSSVRRLLLEAQCSSRLWGSCHPACVPVPISLHVRLPKKFLFSRPHYRARPSDLQ